MNRFVKKYQKQVKGNLHCCRSAKRRLMKTWSVSLGDYLEENPNTNWEDLLEAFGPPAEMAAALSEKITAEEQKR